jgi:hypothetical protein
MAATDVMPKQDRALPSRPYALHRIARVELPQAMREGACIVRGKSVHRVLADLACKRMG